MADLSQPSSPAPGKGFRSMLDRLREKRESIAPTRIGRIPRQAGEGGSFPLSLGQQRLWFLDQLQPGNTAYSIFSAVRLEGPLDARALELSFTEIVRRHESLRTTFRPVGADGTPMQVVSPPAPFPIPVVDLSGFPADDRDREVHRLALQEAGTPFDLEQGPLLRATLLRLSARDHVVLLDMHHIIGDGWSLGILIREMTLLYESFVRGAPSPLSDLPIQYADYAQWQRETLQGETLENLLSFWRRQLSGTPPVLRLPGDRPRPSAPSFHGAGRTVAFSAALRDSLTEMGRREGSTLFIILLGAFQTLLHRYSGQVDLWTGAPVANRKRVEIQELIGFFVNTLVMRGDLSGDPAFAELLARLREMSLEVYSHQDVPFEKVVEEVQPERSAGGAQLLQAVLAFDNAPEHTLSEIALTVLPIEREASPFELTFNFVEGPDGFGGVIEYSTDLFDAPTIARMESHFRTILRAVAADPRRRLSEIPLLSAEEEHQLLLERNDTRVDFPRQCVHEVFDEVAGKEAGRTALTCGGESLTYGELRRRADGLARLLRRLGVGPEVPVAICLDRSVDATVSSLAVLKAGGAYLPLDPSYPAERLSFMVEDTRASVLLTTSQLLPALPAMAKVVCLDRDGEEIARFDGGAPASETTPDNLAYIMYTSGSTGRPKGVGVTHRNIVRLARSANYMEMGPDEVFLQLAPISFDAATLEMWSALLNGGRQEIFPPGVPSLDELGDFLVEREVSALWLTAGLFHQMVEVRLDSLRHVRQLLAGGDALSVPHVRRVLDGLGADSRLVNGYGPTEGTVFSCCNPLRGGDRIDATVPIGRPISNARVYILDANLRLVPGGVPGELYIGGDGLARGYLGRPELTAERFMPDGFGSVPGERLYKTGDLVRSLPDGSIEFLGRIDQQVKIRGFRVELGEVESALAHCPGVADCTVVAREDLPGGKQLVGYVVAEAGLSTDVQALRHVLEARLPEYMVPSAFVFLDALPLTPNGKVDRRALPAPVRTEPVKTQAAPRTPLEQLLAGLWAEVLGVPEVGIHDDFFELGGHSLLATRLMSRVRSVLAVDVPLRELFEAPTVATLAVAVETARAGRAGEDARPAPPMTPVPRDGALPLSFAQERLWFLDQLEPDSPAYNVPFAVSLRGRLSHPALEHGLREVIARHETLRTTFGTADGHPAQIIAPPDARHLPLVDLSGLAAGERETEAHRLIAEEARRPMNLQAGPLLRVGLVRMSEMDAEEHVVLLTMHHIVSDAWSMEILVRDLGAFYRGALEGTSTHLPELAIQYADFSAWQRQWLQGEVLDRELAFWRSRLERSSSVLDFPTDRLRTAAQTFRGTQEALVVPAELGDAVAALARREGVTVFMAGLAAFNALVFRYSGQPLFNVGTPIAGRNRLETEDLIGFFVNTLVLPASLTGDSGIDEVLAQVREITLAAHAHQELPFERLVEELEPERSLTHSPLFQVMFVLREPPRDPVTLPGLESGYLDAETGTTKFDLIFSFSDDARHLSIRYKTDLFDGVTIQRFLRHYRRVLEGVVADPRSHVADLPLLLEEERHQVLEEWNDSAEPFPPDRCVHELFEDQVERTPDAPAVAFEGEVLTYRELNLRANRVAGFLRGRGVGPEVPVGVFMERSIEMVVGLYGILKAGGLYVALAPNFPRERLAFMFEEARVPVLLTQRRLASALPDIATEVVCLDEGTGHLPGASPENPVHRSVPANAAYMIYTSGSTGRPKGVIVEHRQLLQFVQTLVAETGMGPGWTYASVQSPAVDSSKTVLYPPLLTGGCLHMISEERAGDAQAMGDYMVRERIDMLKIAPSHLGTLMSAGEPEHILPRRLLIYGGEPSTRDWAMRLALMAPGMPMYSNYGPTETTVGSSMYEVRPETLHDVPLLPLGRPFPNTRYYLLDRDLRPVPVGVPGEIYIGGRQVTRGYLHRPGLTAERYMPDPFSPEPGARMYRSGDRALYLRDGQMESLGRTDHQIKIRGFRIELGEIEAALALHPGVEACTVATYEERPGDKRLAGFVVAREPGSLDAAGLREYLRESLPEYMVPSVFVFLDALPRSVHGKVDRQALVVPAGAGRDAAGSGEPYEAPRNAAERRMADLWSEVLGREQVGIHDNFFELGGHSLLATRLVSRIRDAFQAELPLRRLFEQPTVAGLAAELETAGSATSSTSSTFEAPPVVPVPRTGAIPLSFAQERLWFLDQLMPGSAVYNIPAAVRLTGRLSIPVLSACLDEIVRRHEVLRTTFPAGPDGPLQLIAPPAPVPLPLIDLSGLGAEARSQEAERLADGEARRPFDLGQGPLLRAALLRLEEREHLALWTLQHIVSDGWSTGVLMRETAALYEAFSSGRRSPLPELPVQYADFSAWQRSWLAAGAEKEQLAYWRERLRGAPPALDLPTDRPRPVVASGQGGLLSFEVPAGDAEALRQLAQSAGATLFMVFLAAFDAVLARYSGQTDLLVGTPIAGRNRSEIEPLIGFFVNTLVLRADLSGLPSAAEVLEQVKTAALEAYGRQDLPFERLVEALAPERSLGRSPLFQVFYVYQNTPREALRLADLSLSFAPLDAGLAKFDLTFTVEEDGEALRGLLSYSHDLFDTTTVERMASHILRALHAMAHETEEPGTPVAHLPLLTPAERQTVLREWNDTGRGYDEDLTLHRLVERQADRTPDALAVVSGRARLSYRELERSANRLANHLRAAGVRRGDRVGIALERSPELVVALLGALKAGATYVPLDPDYPAERLAYMLEDSGIELLISSGSIQLPPHRARVIDLDEPTLLAGESDARPEVETDGDDLAYIIYTSGSTGRPKGTMVPQRAIVNHMLWLQETFFLTASDRVLQKTPFSFDASVWELYAPLLAGATLVMARPGGHREPEYLIQTIQDQGITIFQAVPSLLRAMLEQGGMEGCRSLRTVFCGGEALTPDLVSLYFRSLHALDTELINFYGPTETAIDVTFWRCRPDQDGSVPIGRPLPNTRLIAVTQGYEPAPIGVPGELVVGGRQVGRGYVGMPAMTAEKFVPDPFSTTPGARLYRTGDRVRLLPDGRIDFLGRMDSQVKVRGFRIELGEIETVLAQAPGVARAVVLTRGERNDQLAACVVSDPTGDADAASLRAFLRERLPEHMVPTSFLFLDDLPLSPSGKVDRKALLALDWRGGASGRSEEVSAPRTPTQEILAGIWAGLLDREQVGIRDSFFELGGHSLLATRVASRAREAFGVELPLRSFFEMPTIEALADWIDSQAHGAPQAPPIRPVSRDRALPLSFAQERLWFIDQLQPGGAVYSLPAALRLAGRLDVAALRESFQEVVRRHETLRTTFGETDGAPFQRIATERTVELPVADLRGLVEPARRDEAARLLADEARRPFDLARGALLRVGLVRTDDEEWLLSLNLHHIVSDGWSSGVLIGEVTAVYAALTQGRPSPLPELPVQYADFAAWQREWLRGEVLEERLGFWREALAGAPGLLELPTDRPRPVLPSYRGGEEPLRLSASLSQSLRTLAAREGATLFMVLLAGFQELLRRHTHQEDLLVGSPIAGRDRTEIEGLIGLFINTLVLRRPAGAETFRDLVSGVRRFLLQAYAHQDVPFEKLVEALQVERSLTYSPLFQALFVLRNDKSATLSAPGLELSPLALPEGAAKVDLNLGLGESEDGTLSGELVYAADLFEAATIRRLLERFEILLEAAAADPGRRLPDLPLLTPAERDQLRSWDGAATAYDQADACLHELIEAQIERTPDAVAVEFEGGSLTYRELGQRSGLLAGDLAALGVGPETLVGICAERSLDMVVGLLGILRAGGAYVPLDPGYPADRLAAMLADADVPVLLAQSHLVERLPEHGAQLLVLDALPALGAQPARRGSADSAAYAIFTSGSTGRPKGAVNAHRGIVNRLLWMQSMYGLTAADRVLQKTPFSFDVSVWELFLPLMAGARLVMARPGGHQDPAYLVETIEREGITTMHFVPSMLQVFLEEEHLERCASLRRVIASGEALPAELANRFFSRLTDTELHNLYGPTEAAVDVTYHACVPGEERTPIGRPVANTRIHLVDRELREVPVGVAGELCIGGVQVGRGYLRRPDLTADRFVPDPFGPAGARLYRTGDLARWLPDGEVEYLGRIDHQVKIRGFRIELGEIESALARCPGVREAVVLARGEGADRALVAYLVPPVPERSAGLREHLRASLPEPMIPTGFVFLEAMPLSPNGKVDRKALARQAGVVVGEAEDDTAPRTGTEQRLADLWRQVLGRENIGIHGSFFELGGHSLLATRLMSRVRAAFGVEIPLRELFTSPTVATLAAAVEAAKAGDALPPVPPISRVPRDGALPLSFAQERLWFLDQLEPDSPAYNIPFAVSLRGGLSLAALEHGLRAVVARHETLRTTFRTEADTPVQVIGPPDARLLTLVDLSGLDADMRRTESQRLIEAEARRPFDLRSGPLLRAGLVRLSPREHLALITMHHIVSDAWSVEILVRDLGAFYRSTLEGASADLPELPVQYADYSAWQRRWLRGERLELELAFWRGQLRRMPPVLDLPTDRPRPAVRSLRGAQEEAELPVALAERLAALGRREGVTVFMAGLAAFGALIQRYTGQAAFNVGSPIAGRNHLETEDLIGFFVNTLVLPVRVSGRSRFDEVLARVREITLLAHAHQELPFERLVEDLEPARSLTHSPLFQVMFVLRNLARQPEGLGDLEMSLAGAETGTTKFDLILSLSEDARQLSLRYRADLFEAATIRRFLSHYQRVLEAVANDPRQEISDLPLLSEMERRQLLEEWNDTAEEIAADRCLHELFEEQVERTPDAPAVVFEGSRLTYRELNGQANRLARFLRERGVGPEVPVGLFLERSPEMVVALYGVLKAGGLYVALAPNFPRERLAFMFEQARVPVLLTQERLAPALPEVDAEVVCLDTAGELLSGYGTENPESGVRPQNAAYMIYTSGSTGRPKGVVVEHRQVVSYVRSLERRADLQPGWSFAVVQSPAVDSSKSVLYPALLTGGCLHMISEDRATDAQAMAAYLSGERIDVLKIAPSHLAAMMGAGELERLLPARLLIFGGEPSTREWAARLAEAAPDLPMHSNYGPTETTVGSSMYRLRAGALHDVPLLPLGRAFPNTRYYLLDPALQPVPVGVPGELYIAGGQVTRGYLNAPDLTAERFLPDPFHAGPGERMYRSGDRARWLPDGELESLGRTDHQIKVRGFRVELGEIEAVLALHPGVEACAVSAYEERTGGRRLAGFVVAREDGVDASGLRAFLRERLPEYMVPSVFVFLDALPRSVHGKVDRLALVVPEGTEAIGSGQPYEAPRNPVELRLAGLWGEVLDNGRVGVYDNFFELGGHSLLATRLVSRIRDAFQVELPLRRLFEEPTIAGLARDLEIPGADAQPSGRTRTGVELQAPPIRPASGDGHDRHDGPLPLSFAQERLWFIDQLQPGGSVYSIPAALRLDGRLDVAALLQSFREVVRRHEALRTTFGEAEGVPFQRIAAEMEIELPVTDLRGFPEAQRRQEAVRLLTGEVGRPFDLARGPLMRLRLLRTDDEGWVLFLNLHHIVSDGWSMGVLIREVTTLYAALAQGRPSPLAELPVQYADFSVWQREWLRGEVLEARLDFWKEALAGAPELLELPTDHPRPATQSYRGSAEPLRLSASLSRSLRELAGREGATMFMVLLAGFQELLRRHTHQEDLLVGSPIANRNRTEIEGLIGFFVNTLVLRRPAGAGTFRELLAGVRRFTLQAYAHQDVPFEKLVEALDVERSLAHSPLFQAMFVLQNNEVASLSLPGLEMGPVDLQSGTAKFDIHLGLGESANGGLSGGLVYAADLFEPATIRRLMERFEILLAAAVADPGRRLQDLPVLTPAERDQLRSWDGDATVYDEAEACLHELIEAQIERTPEAVAVVSEGESLTYRELGDRSRNLAHHLRSLGVGPETLVGICAERSLEMIVGLLGILRSGGAYVPLDPRYPADRLAAMLEDADVPVLLAQSHLVDRLPEHGAQLVLLDAVPAAEAQPAWRGGPDSAAYAIFTSGSTGRPKGAVNSHRGIVNRLLWMQSMYGLTAADRVLQKTPFSFDVSVWELFLPLMAGARLVMARPGGHQDPSYLVETIEREGITTMHFVPSMLQVFVEQDDLERCVSLRKVMASGEALPAELTNRFFSRLGHPLHTELHNLYGPTEAAVDVTYHACVPGEERTPIGRPVANTRIHLVDRELREVPVGVAGELCIGGVQVGRGYLRRPDLTADRFVPDPFGPAGARLYRTGDLARWLPNGEVEYLGRLDHQVKIRGFRIELGEIESALARHPGVREAVVLARGEGAERSLVAYLVPPVPEGAAGLREHLRTRLPEHMIPTGFVFLDAMPLSPNGKVDRKVLARMTGVETGETEDDTAPRTGLEQRLADLWTEILGRERIGVHTNFFAAGGHSLLAVRLIARIRKDFGRTLPLGALFQGATIERMAALLSNDQVTHSPLVALQPQGSEPPFFFVHPVGGHVFSYVDLARAMGPEQPFYGLQAHGRTASVEEMAAEYVAAVRSIQPQGPYRLGGWSLGGVIAHEMARQLAEDGQSVESLTLIDSFAPALQDGDVSEASLLARFARDLVRLSGKDVSDFDLTDQDTLASLFTRAEAQGLVPADLALQDAEALFAVFRANLLAVRSFTPRFYPGRLLLVRATESPAEHGWAGLAQDVEIEDVAGDHYSILRHRNAEQLAGLVKKPAVRS